MKFRMILLAGIYIGIALGWLLCKRNQPKVYDAKEVQKLQDKVRERKLAKER
jgi:hypothetical protein